MEEKHFCNICGNELDEWDMQEDFSIFRHLGYGTCYDGETLSLQICCECMDKLIDACEVSPIMECNNTISVIGE